MIKKIVYGLCAMFCITIIGQSNIIVNAEEVTNELNTSGEVSKDKNKFDHIKEIDEDQLSKEETEKILGPTSTDTVQAYSRSQKYTMDQLAKMSYKDMVNTISQIKWDDIADLFKYSQYTQNFFGDINRIKYLITSLEDKGKTFTQTDDKGIPTMVEVLRAGYYLGFYNDGLSYLKQLQYRELCLPALRNIMNNKNFKFGNSVQNGVVKSWGALIGNTTCDPYTVNGIVPLLKNYQANINKYDGTSYEAGAIHSILSSISYSLTRDLYNLNPTDMNVYGKIDSYLEQLNNFAAMKNVNSDSQWIVNTSIYYIGNLGVFYNNSTKAIQSLTAIMDNAEEYSEVFFIAADRINAKYNGVNSRGEKINYKNLQSEGYKKYLSQKYVFDDGNIVINAGNKVTEEKIKRLYWACKEVEAQFFRIVGNDTALENNKADDILTIDIFNSPSEYQINQYLGGLSTDNGGMYIEPTGTFYTYERTSKESIYSLEELFRHEFTHYLQGRYLVPGLWGQGDFYENNELVWFEEGGAEFFAGSTRTEGIKSRNAIVSQLSSKESNMYDLNRLFASNYNDGWSFYNYGWAYISYMYNNDINVFKSLNSAVMNQDINKFRSILNQVKNVQENNNKYKSYIKGVVGDIYNIGTPLVSDDYLQNHAERSLNLIVNDIVAVSNIKNVTTNTKASYDFNTFEVSGNYTGNATMGENKDFKEMNDVADNILKSLNNKGWSGYNTVTCYFSDYKVENGKYTYKLMFRGLLKDSGQVNENQSPIADIQAKSKANINEYVYFNSNNSKDIDGKIVFYQWDFGDGQTSNERNPKHMFRQVGQYSVLLKITDNLGATATDEFLINITKPKESSISSECEPNDEFNEANKYISNNSTVNGILSKSTDKDTFMFNVENPGQVNIKVQANEPNVVWVVYSDKDLSKSVCWKKYQSDNTGTGSFTASKGKYYIVVYGTSDKIDNAKYNINISGIKKY